MEQNNNSSNNRRSFIKKAGIGSAVLLTVSNKAVACGNDNNVQVSGNVSGNASTTDIVSCPGHSCEHWKDHTHEWVGCSTGDSYKSHFGCKPVGGSYDSMSKCLTRSGVSVSSWRRVKQDSALNAKFNEFVYSMGELERQSCAGLLNFNHPSVDYCLNDSKYGFVQKVSSLANSGRNIMNKLNRAVRDNNTSEITAQRSRLTTCISDINSYANLLDNCNNSDV